MNVAPSGLFSFTPSANSVPIARVDGGPLDGVRVWLQPQNEQPVVSDSLVCECGMSFDKRTKLRNHMMSGKCPYRSALVESMRNGEIISHPFDDYQLAEGSFQVIPYECSDENGMPTYSQRIYVSGQSGCGKSRWAGNWLREYQSVYPYRSVTAFCHTPVEDDRAYDRIDMTQLDLENPDFVELARHEVLAGGALDGTICLFDDIDKLEGDAKETAQRLLGQTLMMGRKAAIPVCFCNHLAADHRATRDIFNAMTACVVFPRGGSAYQLDYMLRRHIGVSKRVVNELMDTRPQWAYIHRSWPTFIITNNRIVTPDAMELTAQRNMHSK